MTDEPPFNSLTNDPVARESTAGVGSSTPAGIQPPSDWDPGPLYRRCEDPTCYPPHMPPPGAHYHYVGAPPTEPSRWADL